MLKISVSKLCVCAEKTIHENTKEGEHETCITYREKFDELKPLLRAYSNTLPYVI